MITSKIEENASLLTSILSNNEQLFLFDLLRRSRLMESDFYITIGWLLREGKVFLIEEKKVHWKTINNAEQLWVHLNTP